MFLLVGVTHTKDNNILCQFVVADETGKIVLSLWDHDGSAIRTGEIFSLTAGFVRML